MPTQDLMPAPYVPPATITVVPPTFTLDREAAFRHLVIVLDVQDGQLSAENWHQGRDFHDTKLPSYYPHRDLYFVGGGAHDWWTRDARRLGWSPSHYPVFPGDPATFVATLELMAKWAKELVDALEPLPDGGWDWTPRASAAYERIGYLTSYGTRGLLVEKTDPTDQWHGDGTAPLPDRHHYGAVSFDEVLAAAGPGWAESVWATMTDAQLDDVAASLVSPWRSPATPYRKLVGHIVEERLKATILFSKPGLQRGKSLAEVNQSMPLHVLGARAGLRRWRAARIADVRQMPVQHAAAYFTEDPTRWPETLRAASSDRELERIAELVDAEAAHAHMVALVGVIDLLTIARTDLRVLKRAELAAAGDAHVSLAAELRQLGDRRASLLFEVASFQDGPEWDAEKGEPNYAELGRLARMTRQATRERLTGDAPPPAVPAEDVAAAVREHLRETKQNLSAAQLYAATIEAIGIDYPRAQLDEVLVAMHNAGDVGKSGHVGATYYNPRR